MKFNEIKVNNRVEIIQEHNVTALRNIQGIVLKKENDKIILISVQGEVIEIPKFKVLSVTKINFDRTISEKIVQLKKLYEEIILYEARLKVLKERTPSCIAELQDANFISCFNIEGAKHRLEHSIEQKLLKFENRLLYEVSFDTLQNTHINVIIKIKNKFKLKNDENISDIEKMKKKYCPDEKEILEKIFSYATQVFLSEQEIIVEHNELYCANSTYIISVDINKDNFLRRRKEIRRSLFSLK